MTPINDVWMNQLEETIAEEIIQTTDSYFCNIAANRIDDSSTPDIAKT